MSHGVPSDFTRFVFLMNSNLPEKVDPSKADEGKVLRIRALDKIRSFSSVDRVKPSRRLEHLLIMSPPNVLLDIFSGVPQGSNLGPLLANLIMKEFLIQQSSVSYADDGLFYSDSPFEVFDLPHYGIVLHPDKTR